MLVMEFPAQMNWVLLSQIVLALVLLHLVYTWIYNLFFHPLARFPGPLLGRASLMWRFIYTARGKVFLSIETLHRKYGPIVRISPNELAFASVESLKAIYGHSSPGHPAPTKAPFYDVFGAGFESGCIGSERDPRKHGAMRRMLSSAFSQRSLLEQEKIVAGTIDLFVRLIGEKAPPGSAGINITKWYEMAAFDTVGEMAFGESFGSLQMGKPHSWSELVEEHLYFIQLADNLSRIGPLVLLSRYLFPSTLVVQNHNSRYSREKVEKRLASDTSRRDFCSVLVEKVRSGEVEKEEMAAHVSTLTVAGGETVATSLGGITYLLLKYPEKLEQLTSEIRGAFKSYDEINAQAAQQLKYLQAVINEGMRMFPSGAQGFPRVSPGLEIDGEFIPKGTEIFTSAWTVSHDPQYFESPMEFRPERWLDPNSKDVKEASQPFSIGPRGCLGRNFAYMEMNLILAKVLYTYDLEHVNKGVDWLRDSLFYVMWWKPKLMVRFHKRMKGV